MPTALRLDHAVLAAALVLTALLFTSKAADPVNVIKLTALMLCAIALVASAAVRIVRTRVAQVPWGPAAWIGAALLLAFVVATVAAPVTSTAVLGAYGRNSGLLAYGSAVILFLIGLRVLDASGTRILLYALAGTGLVLAVYGLFQYAGIDPVPWANDDFNPIIATLGNPNFAAAFLAICTPAAAWMALRSDLALPWRVMGAVTALLCLLAALLSEAFQGPLAASAGLFVLALAWVLNQRDTVRKAGLAVLAAGAALGIAAVAAGFAGIGPVSTVLASAGGRARGWYYDAALTMFRENPLVGVGLDTYGGFWWQAKPLEVVAVVGDNNFTNAAHSVPLHLLATGGLVLALAYLAFFGVVAYALVRGLLRLRGPERLLLGAVGGAWAAYQIQSWVSIDQVPLLTAQYVCAAGVVVIAGQARLREVRLPGAPVQRGSGKGGQGRKQVSRPRGRPLNGADYALVALVGLVALGLAWKSLNPLRADIAVASGDRQASAGNGNDAIDAYERAEDLLPGSSLALQRKASLLQRAQEPPRAYAALQEAVATDPYNLGLVRDAAAFAENQGEIDVARGYYDRTVVLEPEGGGTLLRAATFELRHEGAAKALGLLERAAELFPGRAEVLAALGDARKVTGDEAGAQEAYERALAIDPANVTALAGVAAPA